MRKHRSFTPEFKAQVVLEVLSGNSSAAELCRQYELKSQLLSTWKAELVDQAATVFQRDGEQSAAQARIAELERGQIRVLDAMRLGDIADVRD